MSISQTSLVACATKEASFAEQIEKAARYIGKDFVAADGLNSVLGQCRNRSSTCIVVDYETAFEQASSISTRKTLRNLPVLVAVPRGNTLAAFKAANAGATGVFEYDVPHDEVATYLRAAFQSDSEARKSGRFSHQVYRLLKEREKQILIHLMAGEPNKCIASNLDIGLRTVEAGRAELMRKLGVGSLAELVAFVTEVEQDRHLKRQQMYESILNRAEARLRLRA